VVISLTAIGAVTLACIAFTVLDIMSVRQDVSNEVDAVGRVVGGNCAASLVFHEPQWATDVLSALDRDPHVVQAAVFSPDGKAFASWRRRTGDASLSLGGDGMRIRGNVLTVVQPIVLDGDRVGTLVLESSLAAMQQRIERVVWMSLLVLGGATIAAFMISRRTQRLVSDPILGLAAAARHVSMSRDYSTRVSVPSTDELAALTGSFNDMLAEIQHRDVALTDANAELATQFTQLQAESEERRRAEDARRDTEARFQQLAESISEVFWLFDVETNKFLYVSPAYESLFGRRCQDLYEDPTRWMAARHPDDREPVTDRCAVAVDDRIGDREYRIVRPDGEGRVVRERTYPVRDDHGVKRIAAIVDDVTERRSLEEQLRQAQKLEAIGTLAGGIAHDFNNILGAIMGHAELAVMDGDNPAVGKHLEAITAASVRATGLVRQILTFSRRQEQMRERLDLAPIVKETMRLLRASVPTTIEFRVNIETETPPVMADPTEIHQVIMNLGTNAWHAMKDRPGLLEVSLRAFEPHAAFADTRVRIPAGRYALLSVRDTGHGMDQRTVDRIFEPFFTTKGPDEGTGLGLSTVHGIMKHLGGAIAVYSEPRQGTSFRLYFPADEAVDEVTADREQPLALGHGEHVLFLDDEPALVEWGCDALKRIGYVVTGFTKGSEAFAAFAERAAEFDLAITDLTMPHLSGTRFAEMLHTVRPSLPIILMTGNGLALTDEILKRCGIASMLAKPQSIARLAAAVHSALSTRKAA
jgi:PAS domain S-box-containing protein